MVASRVRLACLVSARQKRPGNSSREGELPGRSAIKPIALRVCPETMPTPQRTKPFPKSF